MRLQSGTIPGMATLGGLPAVTPAKAGVQKPGIWIPAQGRNDGMGLTGYFHSRTQRDMTTQHKPIKVLLAKIGLDGHDRGVKIIARALRDAGMEVVYMGMRVTSEEVARAAMQEDVQVVGISILSGVHMRLIPRLTQALESYGRQDVLLLVGGTIPDQDVQSLRDMGVDAVFPVGTFTDAMVDYIRSNVNTGDGA
jgi:methylmalonyl-CoA mutase C-terminal domain/subunit